MGKQVAELTKQLNEARRKSAEHLAGMAFQYGVADAAITKASIDRLLGSGVILTLTAIGGREIVTPVMILDGLSKETVDAIQSDLRRSYLLAVAQKPRGLP